MDFQIEIDQTGNADQTWDKAETILNNIYTSLMVKKGSFFQNPAFGLADMSREKTLETAADKFRANAKDATQWIIDVGRATSIEFVTEIDKSQHIDRLKFQCYAVQADGREVSFEKYLEVI